MTRFETLIRDRRLQIGAVAGIGAIALCGFALAGAGRPEPKAPEMPSVGRLPVELQYTRETPPVPNGKLATLDPSQEMQPVANQAPLDPQLQAMVDQDRREQAAAQAEQRAFDARLRAEMAGSSVSNEPSPTQRTDEAPVSHGSTSNSEDTADQPT